MPWRSCGSYTSNGRRAGSASASVWSLSASVFPASLATRESHCGRSRICTPRVISTKPPVSRVSQRSRTTALARTSSPRPGSSLSLVAGLLPLLVKTKHGAELLLVAARPSTDSVQRADERLPELRQGILDRQGPGLCHPPGDQS